MRNPTTATSIKKIQEFVILSEKYIASGAETKLRYAIQERVGPRIADCIKQYQQDAANIQLEHANVDKDDNVQYTEANGVRTYKYTKEQLKAKDDAMTALFIEEKYVFEPHFVDIPKKLDKTYVEAFTGFVFKEQTDDTESESQKLTSLPTNSPE